MAYEVKIKKLKDGAITPERGSEWAAGYDLYSCLENEDDEVLICPKECVKIGTGLSITPPEGYFGAIFARSGLATKSGLRPANCVGVCDEDYTGEYIVPLYNDSDEPKWITNHMRIAQLVFLPYINVDFVEVDALKDTDRGAGGFGSTGA